MSEPETLRESISTMCQNFYALGWVSGTGGGISIKRGDRIYMAPSGVEKEKIRPEDVFVLDQKGDIVESAANPALKLSECAPLFQSAYELRDAGAVLHSHSVNVVLATMLAVRQSGFISTLEFTQLEMLKGVAGHGYYDTFVLPVIDNTPRECDLTESLREAIARFPKSPAVAVRNHGIYVWGKNEIQAKTQAECIDYLCEVKVKMHAAGITNHLQAAPVA
ncbi:MAG: methylthioribulose 1-phosphate dehydratase [Leptospirales bacterium]|jgi:methylthioribulose-1-phosphate dehydratase